MNENWYCESCSWTARGRAGVKSFDDKLDAHERINPGHHTHMRTEGGAARDR